ncbi:MAG TPA: phenylacetic acid degradation protein [Candidatus Binatia bacterium]|nr:phenylacetic acid degradation protein [Candidatus Binatia bacterium]
MAGAKHGDTQWARFEVFQQTREGAPFASVGSVHAPDAEIALQNARDVFVRRPQTHRLWVVSAGEILSRTRQEIEQEGRQTDLSSEAEQERPYYVFRKTSQRRSMTFVAESGEVWAPSADKALCLAIKRFGDEGETYVWWIVPADAVVASEDGDVASMFEPALDKSYRMPADYRTQTMMRELEERDGDG